MFSKVEVKTNESDETSVLFRVKYSKASITRGRATRGLATPIHDISNGMNAGNFENVVISVEFRTGGRTDL